MEMVFYIAIACTFFCVVALLVTPIVIRPTAAESRLLEMVATSRKAGRQASMLERLQEGMSALVKRGKGVAGISDNAVAGTRLASAGFRKRDDAEMYFAARILSPLAGILAASFTPSNTLGWMLVGGGLGYMAPDMWLRSKIKKRKERIRKGFPDAVDLLVICMDAGLGLDQAILRVGQELISVQPDITQEFAQLNLEQRAGKPRMEAWQSMAERTKIPDIASFVSMLTQTDRFGTPILASLSRLSNDIRLKRRQLAEEMAAKTKILFPLVLFIFPCIFIVLLAPALLSIAKTLGAISK